MKRIIITDLKEIIKSMGEKSPDWISIARDLSDVVSTILWDLDSTGTADHLDE